MENLKNANLNNTTNVVNNKAKLSISTLKNLAEKISDSVVNETKTKNVIYKFELQNLTEKQRKDLRRNIRKERNELAFRCAQVNKKIISANKDESKLISELNLETIENFAKFYQKTYCTNNFTFESISNSKMQDDSGQINADRKNIEFSLSMLQLSFELNIERITKIFSTK